MSSRLDHIRGGERQPQDSDLDAGAAPESLRSALALVGSRLGEVCASFPEQNVFWVISRYFFCWFGGFL